MIRVAWRWIGVFVLVVSVLAIVLCACVTVVLAGLVQRWNALDEEAREPMRVVAAVVVATAIVWLLQPLPGSQLP